MLCNSISEKKEISFLKAEVHLTFNIMNRIRQFLFASKVLSIQYLEVKILIFIFWAV